MAVFSTEARVDKHGDQILGERLPDHPGSEAKNVDVVMFHHLVSRIRVMGDTCSDPMKFVGGDCGASAGPTHDDTPFRSPVEHRLGNRCGVVRIVDRVGGVGAKVVDRMPGLS